MANKKISELTALTTPAAADDFVVRDDSEASVEKTKKIAFSALQTGILSHATELPITIGGDVQVNFSDGEILPETDDDINLGSSTYQFKRLYVERGITINNINQGEDATAAINTKIVEIGDWNMDSTASVTVTHGLTLTKIRGVSVVIQNDASTAVYSSPMYGLVANDLEFGVATIGSTTITLYRRTSGGLDSTDFNATSFNRGWVTIWYVN